MSTWLLITGLLPGQSHAAAGDLDFSFDAGSGLDGDVSAMVVQPDGRVVVGGRFTTVKGVARYGIARLNADGSADTSFNPPHGTRGTGPWPAHVSCLALQPDGRVLIGGDILFSNVQFYGIARLNSNGVLDTSFNPGTGPNGEVWAIGSQTDGKVLIGGWFQSVNGIGCTNLARLNADGSLDTSFSPNTRLGLVRSITVQHNGRILVATANGFGQIVRLSLDGSRDSSFNPPPVSEGWGINAVAVQNDGKVLIGGYFGDGNNYRNIVRLESDGSLDTSFDVRMSNYPGVWSVAVEADGSVLIGGQFYAVNGVNRTNIARLHPDGSLDTDFRPGLQAGVDCIAVQADGRLLIGGAFTRVNGSIRRHMARLDSSGGLDESFDPSTGPIAVRDSVVRAVALQPDGKVLIGGAFSEDLAGHSGEGIIRLNVDGTRDTSFYTTVEGETGTTVLTSILAQPDGKVLIGGSFTHVNGSPRTNLARLAADGNLDTSFDARGAAAFYSMGLQSDGKLLVGGAFSPLDGWGYVRRFQSNGSLDASFDGFPAVGLLGANAVAVQSDGKVLIAGGGIYSPVFVRRLNPDGSPDPNFHTYAVGGFGLGTPSIALQADGKVLIAGDFTMETSTNRIYIARLNSDGIADTSFQTGIGPDGYVKSLAVQSDGKILIGGLFRQVSGTNRSGVARLNPDGSLDAYFDPGTGVDFIPSYWYVEGVSSVLLQPDGKVLIGGNFTSVNGVARWHIARLWGDAALCTAWMRTVNGEFVARFGGTPGLTYTIEYSEGISPTHWQKLVNRTAPTTDAGPGIGGFEFQEPMSPTGQRFYRAVYPAY
jgi:uncharacterized delta-60 repeat protein